MFRTYLIILSGIIFLGCLTVPAGAQNKLNAEQEYSRIREIAFKGELATAETDARRLVKAAPGYGDARILLGRILAWQKKYGEAAAVIDTLLTTEPDNSDAISARKDISQWSKSNTPVSTELKAGYSFDQFGLPYSRFWQIFNAGAGHKFKWGKGSAGVNIGNLITGEPSAGNSTEIQFEAEVWPQISDKNYGFVSYAYSPGTSFPEHRAAAELWQMLPEGFAVSAGVNFYYFDRAIFIALLSGEKYIGNFWFSARGFLYFKDIGPTASLYINGRRYFGDRDYLQATIGFGTAPDEPFDIESDLMRMSAYSLRLAYSLTASPKISIRIGAGYSREEYAESAWRNRFEGGIGLTYALKMK